MGSGKRIKSLTEETSVLSTDQIAIDRDGYTYAKKATIADISAAASSCLITDAGIISVITDEGNWADGAYTGSTAGLSECNYFVDSTTRIKYEFDGTILIRYSVNNVI